MNKLFIADKGVKNGQLQFLLVALELEKPVRTLELDGNAVSVAEIRVSRYADGSSYAGVELESGIKLGVNFIRSGWIRCRANTLKEYADQYWSLISELP